MQLQAKVAENGDNYEDWRFFGLFSTIFLIYNHF
jgi:hypothetical protein